MKASEWHPIESAPKDGTKVLIKMEGEFNLEGYYGGGADKAFREWTSCRQIIPQPTHWMPLPEAPK